MSQQTFNVSKPSFFFLEQPLDSETLEGLNEMLEVVIGGNYIYELVIGYDAFREE